MAEKRQLVGVRRKVTVRHCILCKIDLTAAVKSINNFGHGMRGLRSPRHTRVSLSLHGGESSQSFSTQFVEFNVCAACCEVHNFDEPLTAWRTLAHTIVGLDPSKEEEKP